jgi:FeS assembly SUF system protein
MSPSRRSLSGLFRRSPKATAPSDFKETNTMDEALRPEGETDSDAIRPRLVEALKTVYDPEIPVDIYELGLIYEVEVREEAKVYIKMTLTSPMCPVAEILPQEVEEKLRAVDGVRDVSLELVWDPPWNPDMMSEAAKLTLNF